MEPLAFTTTTGSTYVVVFHEDGAIDVARMSDHPVRWAGADGPTSFVRRYTSVEFVTGPRGLQVRFGDARDPDAAFLTSPLEHLVPVRG
jgi:hypothetical protein